jgi:hypothetical protein
LTGESNSWTIKPVINFFTGSTSHFVMRTYLSLFLAVILSLNASFVAVVGVCDALEHTAEHTAHFLHHSHEHSNAPDHDAQQSSTDEIGKVTSSGNHYHNHAHPSFSSILPDSIGIMPLTDDSTVFANHAEVFVSVSPALLDRPPRATLA